MQIKIILQKSKFFCDRQIKEIIIQEVQTISNTTSNKTFWGHDFLKKKNQKFLCQEDKGGYLIGGANRFKHNFE